ncbi:type I glyceraldehyde-3-phosphate dehydrogenase [Actinocrinis puniceicyclus]|uniref:Type I glyceraldehyde-3-phosphate dehydrogenase n=1 Tax=Actinocrinis puniceicyclus TaxID=977794 RepID=A0A8J8BBL3_9ACTN|nr:type I glyceraldehyde-3-phosphate dehydrogenase [Actinocrinis puniceicyclus]MBS2964177.1 type I glyceraldehyde-3-phosphate dehydrogenase [Actinocrinis puniceicyclus]
MRIAVNGFGRIGRVFTRIALQRGLEVVAVNDITDAATLAHLLGHDSTYGRLRATVEYTDEALIVDGRKIAVTAQREPETLPWGDLGVDVVIESTGKFRTGAAAGAHLKAGARKVLISAPAKGAVDLTVVMGVNQTEYDPAHHHVISNASCTTNCAAPMVDVLQRHFGIVEGFLTTIHGYTNDQQLLDGPHKDLRRARSAALNIIPTSTGAAKAIGLVIPQTAGLLDGIAVRVPVPTGSLVDLAAQLVTPATPQEINAAFEQEAGERLRGILRVSEEPLVSTDIIGDSASCVLDKALTQSHGGLAKVFGWYDNEWGYTERLADLAEYVGARL